ncbi:MAG: histidine phosphatase family protein [Pseudomonadota bacterium]
MTTFYLIRHGQTDWNAIRKVMGRTDVPLNSVGVAQAKDLSGAMSRYPIDAIVTSPQLRARQTADVIGAGRTVPVRIESALAEVEFGPWVGMGLTELNLDPEFHLWLDDPNPKGSHTFERSADVRKRTSEVLERLASENPSGTFALVSHADPIRAMVNYALGGPVEEFRRIRIVNASLTVVLKEANKWRLTLLNYRPEPDLRAEI